MKVYDILKDNVIAYFCNEYVDKRKMDQFIEYRYKNEDYKIFYNDEMVEIALNDEIVCDELFELDMVAVIVSDIIRKLYNNFIDGESTAFIACDLLERHVNFFHMDELVEEEVFFCE